MKLVTRPQAILLPSTGMLRRVATVKAADGVALALHELSENALLHASTVSAAVLFVHGTGFHAHTWLPVMRRVKSDTQLFAVDMRGHGQSDKPEPPYDWAQFAHDVVAVAKRVRERTGGERCLAVGHSMGGYAVALAAAQEPDLFSEVVLIDPVIFPDSMYDITLPFGPEHFAAKRRARWPSVHAFHDALRTKGAYRLWTDEAMRDYCEHALTPSSSGSGELELACPPHIESNIYVTCTQGGLRPRELLHRVRAPVTLLRARTAKPHHASTEEPNAAVDMTASPTDPGLAAHFPCATDHFLPHLSHFIPMQDPQLVANTVDDLLKRTGPAPSGLRAASLLCRL